MQLVPGGRLALVSDCREGLAKRDPLTSEVASFVRATTSSPERERGRKSRERYHSAAARSASPPCARCSTGFSACVRLKAVFASPTWENACGKLPARRLLRGSYSSLSRPTSLHSDTRRLNRASASARRPCR